jgi:hypothetical protein
MTDVPLMNPPAMGYAGDGPVRAVPPPLTIFGEAASAGAAAPTISAAPNATTEANLFQ